ncbi:MAG TPA: PAS domain-containing protein [Iamia sp.]|jgi:two-component system CheB/CheR fusion protein|nr:PAS domain-containing protein [Iamia sp.]
MSTPSPALDGLLSRLRELGLDDQLGAELSAVHDELKATVAQMGTANEELVASNAELEAMGQELERAATELSAVNEELEQRSGDIERITGYLQSVIDGVPGAVVVLDVDQKVRAWSTGAAERWGATSAEVSGKAFGRLDLHGETPDVLACVRATLAGEPAGDEPVAVGDDGTEARCRPLHSSDGAIDGAVLFVAG